MSICVPCNRTFASDTALKQHETNSPKHPPFDCKACKRSFGSHTALSQHQKASPAHQNPRKDSVTTEDTPISSDNHVPLLSSTSPNVRSTTHNGRRNHHTAAENSLRANPTLDSPSISLENQLRDLTISDVNTIVAPPKIHQAHIPSRRQEPRFFTFSELHQRIAEAVTPEITSTWYNHNKKADPEDRYTTSVMGKFTCRNRECKKRQWSSKVVAIGIQGYPRNGYNAIVYNQHCDSCKRLGSFKLNAESYVERIAYRLKVWADVPVEKPPYGGPSRAPHESALCEGCKVDDCPWMKKSLY